MRKTTIALLAGVIFAYGCKKSEITSTEPTTANPHKKSSTTQSLAFTSDRTYNLNVVYFIPSDYDTLTNYRTKLSEVMNYVQEWYKDEMTRNGYTNKTFGLMKDGSEVKIQVVRGALTSASYDKNSATTIKNEINAYFSANPGSSSSTHTLVLTPPVAVNPDGSVNEGRPYYGSGQWCFAIYYEGMHMEHEGEAGVPGDKWTLYVGGLAHELGHAFNLPHDKQTVSETTASGKALMYLGNYTLGKTPTTLTPADAAILNRVSVFNTDAGSYYGSATASIYRIWARYDVPTASMIVSGKFTATSAVSALAVYNDPNVNNEGVGTNKDYNAITWKANIIGTDSFYVAMPINDLEYKTSATPYEMKFKFVHNNGTHSNFTYHYNFNGSNVPELKFGYNNNYQSRTGWAINSYSSQESGNPATNLIDGTSYTFWHSRWSSNATSYPHTLVIDMGSVKTVNGIAWRHRQSINGAATRAVKTVEILGSTNGTTFTSIGTFTLPNKNDGMNHLDFSTAKSIRYFKANMTNAWDGGQNAAIAELYTY